jgi:hypothetical protein
MAAGTTEWYVDRNISICFFDIDYYKRLRSFGNTIAAVMPAHSPLHTILTAPIVDVTK